MNNNNISKAIEDFISSFSYWRIFCLFGIHDIRKRYIRSNFGQLWITLSLAVQILCIGVIWGYMFKIQMEAYMPYLATGMVFWNYVVITLMDGSSIYIFFTPYMKELSIPKLSYINSLIVKNLIILLHNVVVLIPIYLYYCVNISWDGLLLSLLGMLLMMIFSYLVIIPMALVGLRYRDIPNIIQSIIPLLLYITPIMWRVDLIPAQYHHYMVFNPITVFISLCRDPLIGASVNYLYYFAATIYIAVFFVISAFLFSKFRSRIVYWL